MQVFIPFRVAVRNSLSLVTFLLFFSTDLFAQLTIYSENMGSGGNAPLNTHVFQNTACNYTYSGTGSTSNQNQSMGYTGSTGSKNIELTSSQNFIIAGINTLGYSSITLSYGLYKSGGLALNDPDLRVEVSTNGSTYTTLTRPAVPATSLWVLETCSGIPSASKIYLRFTNANILLLGATLKIDDVLISGTSSLSVGNPVTYNGWPAAYSFSTWPSTSAAGTYPSNMIFHYASATFTDPTLSQTSATQNYLLDYSLTCGTRIKGLGTTGVSFINTNPGNTTSIRGNLGEAVVALNTTCRRNIQVTWAAGTITNNNKPYRLRAQYRIGATGNYVDLPNTSTTQIEYISPSPTTTFSPITLPATCDNQSVVHIRWVYYSTVLYTSGDRDEIFLDNISISSSTFPLITPIASQTVCGGKSLGAISFSASVPSTYFWSNDNSNIGIAGSGTGNIPAFTASILSTSTNQVAGITFTAVVNSCTSAPTSFSITVRAPQPSSIWSGSVSSNWFDPDNWSNCVCGANTSATISSTTNNPIINNDKGIVKDLVISTTKSLTLTSGYNLDVYGNWTNNGSFIQETNSTVSLLGNVTQTLGGSTVIPFKNLTLNNNSGSILTSSLEISGTLQLTAGTFSTNNLLTIKSTSLETGRIGAINPAANIVGNVTIQRTAPGGSTGWAHLGSPISSSLTMNDWNDDFFITCSTCPNGYYGFTSIYSYSEAAVGSYSAAGKYTPINAITDNLVNTKGYWVYLGNSSINSTDINFDVTGTVAKGSISIPLSNSNTSDQVNYGWNLISNPLPSAISGSLLLGGNTNVDQGIYVYNADAAGGQGGYTSYINGVSTGGLTDNIPMCQGFYVHAKANTTLTATENIKVNANPTFLKSSNSGKPIFRLFLNKGPKFSDETVFYFEKNGAKIFQGDLDARKLNFDPINVPYIGSLSDSILTSISCLPPLKSNIKVGIKAITPTTTSYTFSTKHENFPGDVCITLFDKVTKTTTDLLAGDYVCTLYDTTTSTRFDLQFYRKALSAVTLSNTPTCKDPQSGTLVAYGNNSGPWNYEWRLNDSVVKSGNGIVGADTLKNLTGGIYSLILNTVGECDQ